MNKKITIIFIFQCIILLILAGCGHYNDPVENTSLKISDYYGEYIFERIAYMRKASAISEKQYQNDLETVTETFKDAEFSIQEGYFYETSGAFGENASKEFEFITMKDYGEKYYDDLARETIKDFKGLDTVFDYDNIKKELNADQIEHYVMYFEDGVLLNPTFYITKDNIFVAMETISFEEKEDNLKGYTHYLLKLTKN